MRMCVSPSAALLSCMFVIELTLNARHMFLDRVHIYYIPLPLNAFLKDNAYSLCGRMHSGCSLFILLFLFLFAVAAAVCREVRFFATPPPTAACCASLFTLQRSEQDEATLDSAPSTSQGFAS